MLSYNQEVSTATNALILIFSLLARDNYIIILCILSIIAIHLIIYYFSYVIIANKQLWNAIIGKCCNSQDGNSAVYHCHPCMCTL